MKESVMQMSKPALQHPNIRRYTRLLDEIFPKVYLIVKAFR